MEYHKQNYSYALNNMRHLINVKQAVRKEKYFCPFCGKEMIPRMGKVRKKHFAHKNEHECKYESYLHKIAKLKIKDAFYKSQSFEIKLKTKFYCNKKCPFPFSKSLRCYKPDYKKYNLKKYYTHCEEEKTFNSFTADLMLTSEDKKCNPLIIEIWVTHKSTEEKIKSGERIIEIKVSSIEDIEEIADNCRIEGIDYSLCNENNNYNQYDECETIFYNFKPKELFLSKDNDDISRVLHIYSVNNIGSIKHSDDLRCQYSINEICKINNCNYVLSNWPMNWRKVFFELIKKGVKIRNCMICKYYKYYYGNRSCTIYKNNSIKTKYAMECPNYKQIEEKDIEDDLNCFIGETIADDHDSYNLEFQNKFSVHLDSNNNIIKS